MGGVPNIGDYKVQEDPRNCLLTSTAIFSLPWSFLTLVAFKLLLIPFLSAVLKHSHLIEISYTSAVCCPGCTSVQKLRQQISRRF